MSTNGSQSAPSDGKQRVLVNVILDKSGSMSTKVQDVIGGFNLYLSTNWPKSRPLTTDFR